MMELLGQYIRSKNGVKLFSRLWKPHDKPWAIICLLHGLGEHSGRYEKWAELFTQQGIAFFAIDLRGHGKSYGKRGHISSYKKLFFDIDMFLAESEHLFPGIPKILYGHSLGGNLALNYYFGKNNQISGLIISSPWLQLSSSPSNLKLIGRKLIKIIYPSFTVKNGINPKDISRDSDVVESYKTNKLVHNKISVKLYFNAAKFGKEVIGKSYLINIPLLVMHGTEDKITSFKATSVFARNTGAFTTFKLWEGCFHELHNELNNQEIFNYIIDWLKTNFQTTNR